MSAVTSLPTETLDHIASALESLSDLQNFAVAAQLQAIVSPRHTQFRIVRAPLISPIWQKFIQNKSLAQNVRILEIQAAEAPWNQENVDSPVIPAIFKDGDERQPLEDHKAERLDGGSDDGSDDEGSDDDSGSSDESDNADAEYRAKNLADLGAERILISALKNMTGLTSFQWSRTPPLVDPKAEPDVWTTLVKSCPNLREVNVVDSEKPHEYSSDDDDDNVEYQRPSRNPAFFVFKNLASFTMKTHAFNVGSYGTPDVESFANMLVKDNPDLETLQLEFLLYQNPVNKTADATPIFSNSYWKSLRRLCLFSVHAPSTAVSSFLTLHPTIEHLSLVNLICSTPLLLPAGVLPSLKSLNASWEDISAILQSCISAPRPLEWISGAPLDGSFLELLQQSGSGATLKRLDAKSCADPSLVIKLAKLAPGIKWLSLSYSGSPQHAPNLDWHSAIEHLPALTTFEGVQLLLSDKSSSQNSEIIRALVTACPKLRRVPWYMANAGLSGSVVIIERSGTTVTWSLRAVLGDTEGAVNSDWGENGKGSFEL